GGFGAALRASRLPPLRGVRRLDVRVGWWGCTDERPRPLLASALEVAAGSLGELRRLDGAEPLLVEAGALFARAGGVRGVDGAGGGGAR
ncbi:MAG: hypothetical protein ACI8PZ_005876, partial [Myxococcota bacterium]